MDKQKKPFKIKILIFTVLTVVLLVAGSVIAYASFKRDIEQLFMNDEQYVKKMIKNSVVDMVNEFIDSAEMYVNDTETINQNELEAVLSLDYNISVPDEVIDDFSDMWMLPDEAVDLFKIIGNSGVELDYKIKLNDADEQMEITLMWKLNKQEILTATLLLSDGRLYISCPALYDKVFAIDLPEYYAGDIYGGYLGIYANDENFNPDLVKDLCTEISNNRKTIIAMTESFVDEFLNNIDDFAVLDNTSIDVADNEIIADEATFTINEKTYLKALSDSLDVIIDNDDYIDCITDIINSISPTKIKSSEVSDGLESMSDFAKDADPGKEKATFGIYINSKNEINGCKIESKTASMGSIFDLGKGYSLWIDADDVEINLFGSINGNLLSASGDMFLTIKSDEISCKNLKILTYDDVTFNILTRTVKGEMTIHLGSILDKLDALESLDSEITAYIKPVEIIIDMEASGNKYSSGMKIQNEKKDMSVEVAMKLTLEDVEIDEFSDDEVIVFDEDTDFNNIDIDFSEIESGIYDIIDKIGDLGYDVDMIEELFEGMFGGMFDAMDL